MRRSQQVQELRERNPNELDQELKDTRSRLFQDRIRYATRNLDNPAPIRAGKKRIARILTLMRQQEIKTAGGQTPKKRK